MSDPVITLKAVKFIASMTEETNCYTATVLVDGVKVGTISNRGCGGGSDFRAVDRTPATVARVEAATAYAKTQGWTHDAKFIPYIGLEDLVDVLAETEINRQAYARAFRRDLKKRTLIFVEGRMSYVAASCTDSLVAALRQQHGADLCILNVLPVAEAEALYIKAMKAPSAG